MFYANFIQERLRIRRWGERDISRFLPFSLAHRGYKLLEVVDSFEGDDPVLLVDGRGNVVKMWDTYATLTDIMETAIELEHYF